MPLWNGVDLTIISFYVTESLKKGKLKHLASRRYFNRQKKKRVTKYVVRRISKSISNDDLPEKAIEILKDQPAPPEASVFEKCTNLAGESKYVEGNLKFYPAVYIQRYEAVALVLQESPWKDTLRKVVDFGCSEMGFFLYLKQMEGVEEIIEVDIDEGVLERYCSKASPFYSDYLFCKRAKPLDVYVLAGSIAEYDDHLAGTDAVVAIELIEHLDPESLKKMPHTIFHEIKPKIAVFTTPNSDFNVLFSSTGFRHNDHQFEWSRKEFYNWTKEITDRYPDYSVKFYGIGMGPQGTENLGCCTQMAVFHRRQDLVLDPTELYPKGIHTYKLVRKIEYPFYVDSRTTDEKIIDEVLYRVKFSLDKSDYYNYDEYCTEIPLSEFVEYVDKWCPSVEQLQMILENHGFRVKEKNGSTVLVYIDQMDEVSDSNYEGSEEYNKDYIVDTKSEVWDSDYYNDSPRNSTPENVIEEPNFESARSLEKMSCSSPLENHNGSNCNEYVESECWDDGPENEYGTDEYAENGGATDSACIMDGVATDSASAEDEKIPEHQNSTQEMNCFGRCSTSGDDDDDSKMIPSRKSLRELGRTSRGSKVLKSWIHSHIGL